MGNQCSMQNQGDTIDSSGARRIALSDFEKMMIKWNAARVGAITFYQGTPPEAMLRDRVNEMVTANPWLSAVLRKDPQQGFRAEYRKDSECFGRCFEMMPSRDLRLGNDYATTFSQFQDAVGRNSKDNVGTDQPIFKVALYPGLDEASFALVVSLDHALGDGHTFYALSNMLDCNATVEPLDIARPTAEYKDALTEALGAAETNGFANPGVSDIIGFVSSMAFKKKPVAHTYEVDNDALKAAKEAAASSSERAVSFVSSNDVLTSWFMCQNQFSTGAMAINMRGRLKGVGNNLAGNYEAAITYRAHDFASPSMIRQSLLTPGHYHRATNSSLPGIRERLKNNAGIVTNWASFAEDVSFPGCEQLLHLPLMDLSNAGMMGGLCVIFRPRQGKLGMMMVSRHEYFTSGDFSSHPLIGTRLL